MIEKLLHLKDEYLDSFNFDFHNGNLGASFAFITLASALENEEVYDFGTNMLSEIMENNNGLDKYHLLFLGSMVSFMERNQYLDINSDFYQKIDDYSKQIIQEAKISHSDMRIFLFLYYFSNRINSDNFEKNSLVDVSQTIAAILCELIMKVDEIRQSQDPKDVLRFLFFCKMVAVIFNERTLFSKLTKRLLETVEASVNYTMAVYKDLNLEESLYLHWILNDSSLGFNDKFSPSLMGVSVSRSIQNLFLLSSDHESFSAYINNIGKRLIYKNFGLLNSNLGTLLQECLKHARNFNDIVFLIQLYDNKKI